MLKSLWIYKALIGSIATFLSFPLYGQLKSFSPPTKMADYPICSNLDSLEIAVRELKSDSARYLHGLITLELNRRVRSDRFGKDLESIKTLATAQNSEIGLAMFHYISFFKTYLYNLEESAQNCLKNVEFFEKNNDTLGMVSVYYQMVVLNHSLLDEYHGSSKTAQMYYDKIVTIESITSDSRTKLLALSLIVMKNNELGKGENHLAGSLDAFKKVKDIIDKNPIFEHHLSTLYTNMGKNFWWEKQFKELLIYHRKAFELSKNMSCDKRITDAFNLGNAYRFNNQHEKAEKYVKLSIRLHEECSNENIELYAHAHKVLTELLFTQKKYTDAWKVKITTDSLNTLVQKKLRAKNLLEIETKYETEKKEYKNKQLQLEKEKAIQKTLILTIALASLLILLLIMAWFFQKIQRNNEELSKLNQLIQKQNEDLIEANLRMEHFSYALSHDAIAYINHIINFSNISMNANTHDVAKNFAQKVYRNANNLKKMANNLIFYNKMKQGNRNLELVDFSELMAEVKGDLELDLIEKNIALHVSQLPVLLTNRELIKQVLHNLVGNSIKFTRQDANPEIKIEAKKLSTQFYEFKIQDNGIGINPEKLPLIFHAFTKGNKTKEGSGLGLYICKEIIENIGGEIRVESTFGKGTTFYFTIPHLTYLEDWVSNNT